MVQTHESVAQEIKAYMIVQVRGFGGNIGESVVTVSL
jgi:hypothetical protein